MVIEDLRRLVETESPTSSPQRCAEAGAVLAGVIGRDPDQVERAADGREHYVWRWPGPSTVMLVGHIDTVWPEGTVARWPFAVDGDRATGPGTYDMKCGLVVAAHALRALGEPAGVTLVVNSDEETGSVTSRDLIEREASGARGVLVLEGGASGCVKVGRKGVGMYVVAIDGRAAHAGLEPQKGVNALVEAAHQTLAIASLSMPERGTTVTPTMAAAGTARNVVPAHATLDVDVRVTSAEEASRIDAALQALEPALPGAALHVSGGLNRPPMPRSAAEGLYSLAASIATERFGAAPGAIEVGGGSDGNFTAAMGIPTLDGLGGDGGNAHAEGEWVSVSSIEQRIVLVAEMIRRLNS